VYLKSGDISAKTANSDLGKRMTIRSAVDKNIVLLSGLTGKPKAKPSVTLSGDIPDLTQLTADAKEDEQAIAIKTKGRRFSF